MDTKRWIIFICAVVALFGGMALYSQYQKASMPKSSGSMNYYGKSDSKVTLTEYVDFQCEACYSFYPTVKEVKEKYKDRVNFRVRYFPIANSHKFARLAASYAEGSAQQGKFWEMHDMIFEGQKEWQVASDPTTYFESYAKDIGLDLNLLESDRKNPMTAATINADLDAVKALGGDGTPTFALNGKKIDNPDNDLKSFSAVLDTALKESTNEK